MPELPEVETVRRALAKRIIGSKIMSAESDFPKIVAYPSYKKFAADIRNRKIEAMFRRGKFLIFDLSGDISMISHLRMTGHWLVTKNLLDEKFIHLKLKLSDGRILAYGDIRKFGRIWLIKRQDFATFKPFAKLGIEPLSDGFTTEAFSARLAKYKNNIKQVLLNQEVVTGLGNIYVDEVLFAAGVRPLRKVPSLTKAEIERIFKAIRRILPLAIKHGGTTVENFTTPEGGTGYFQNKLKIYGRKGEKCYNCEGTVSRVVVAGRGTHYCKSCQK